MARPRLESGEPAACDRIREAFWSLLEQREYPELSVGMLVGEAGCNRGTFYYHFDSLDTFASALVEKELLADGVLPFFMCELLTGGEVSDEDRALLRPHVMRLSLISTKGGVGVVVPVIRRLLARVWQDVLGVDFDLLTLDARIAIEYCGSGMIGLLANPGLTEEAWGTGGGSASFAGKNFEFILSCIGEAQGIPAKVLRERLRGCYERAAVEAPRQVTVVGAAVD